eukprot:1190743-Prorocentrum_minimum.AAC.2
MGRRACTTSNKPDEPDTHRKRKSDPATSTSSTSNKLQRRASPDPSLLLNTDALIPTVQLGTYRMKGPACTAACTSALCGDANGRARHGH